MLPSQFRFEPPVSQLSLPHQGLFPPRAGIPTKFRCKSHAIPVSTDFPFLAKSDRRGRLRWGYKRPRRARLAADRGLPECRFNFACGGSGSPRTSACGQRRRSRSNPPFPPPRFDSTEMEPPLNARSCSDQSPSPPPASNRKSHENLQIRQNTAFLKTLNLTESPPRSREQTIRKVFNQCLSDSPHILLKH